MLSGADQQLQLRLLRDAKSIQNDVANDVEMHNLHITYITSISILDNPFSRPLAVWFLKCYRPSTHSTHSTHVPSTCMFEEPHASPCITFGHQRHRSSLRSLLIIIHVLSAIVACSLQNQNALDLLEYQATKSDFNTQAFASQIEGSVSIQAQSSCQMLCKLSTTADPHSSEVPHVIA